MNKYTVVLSSWYSHIVDKYVRDIEAMNMDEAVQKAFATIQESKRHEWRESTVYLEKETL